MALKTSANATELQSMCCRLDAGRDQEPIEDLGSNESCSPTRKSYNFVRDTYVGCQLAFREEQRWANLICEDEISDDQSE